MKTLREELENNLSKTRGYTSYDKIQIDLADQTMSQSHIPRVGDNAIPFSLPKDDGTEVSLADLIKSGPVILNFYRGNFCEYCRLELKALERSLSDFERYHATLVGISPSLISMQSITTEENELSFAILSDEGNGVAKNYGLSYKMNDELTSIFEGFGIDMEENFGTNNETGHNLTIPATFVVDRHMKIVYSYANSDHTKRAEPTDIIANLMSIA